MEAQHHLVHIVEDEKDIARLIQYNLVLKKFRAIISSSGESAIKSIKENPPQIILLDLMLPGIDGLETCRILKSTEGISSIPIIMLTAKGSESDIVRGLEMGADDYITKPFSQKVLIARIESSLRRVQKEKPDQNHIVQSGDLRVDPQ